MFLVFFMATQDSLLVCFTQFYIPGQQLGLAINPTATAFRNKTVEPVTAGIEAIKASKVLVNVLLELGDEEIWLAPEIDLISILLRLHRNFFTLNAVLFQSLRSHDRNLIQIILARFHLIRAKQVVDVRHIV